MLQQLKERYDRYAQEAGTVRENAKFGAGLLGFGSDPRKDPCHMAFYKDAQKWMTDFMAAAPDSREACQAAEFILSAPVAHRGEDAYWFMYAAHGLCLELIPLLNAAQCARLAELYDREYPRRDRMAVQKEVYKRLRKGAGNQETR